jgi:cell division protein FtsL
MRRRARAHDEGGVSRPHTVRLQRARRARTVVAVAVLLASLGLVAWRQGRALEALAELDRVHGERALLTAEKTELERRAQALASRGRVLPEARVRLGLRTPEASEIVILRGEAP